MDGKGQTRAPHGAEVAGGTQLARVGVGVSTAVPAMLVAQRIAVVYWCVLGDDARQKHYAGGRVRVLVVDVRAGMGRTPGRETMTTSVTPSNRSNVLRVRSCCSTEADSS